MVNEGEQVLINEKGGERKQWNLVNTDALSRLILEKMHEFFRVGTNKTVRNIRVSV